MLPDYLPIKDMLQARQSALRARVTELEISLRRTDGPRAQDFEDNASETEGDEVMQGLDDIGRRELTEIEAALARMDAGTYGLCERTGRRIPIARLHAIPTARTVLPGTEDDD